MSSPCTPGSVASQSAAFATSPGCCVPQSSRPVEGGHPRMESASATYPCSDSFRAVSSTRGAPGTPSGAHPCSTMIAICDFSLLAGRKRIPPRVTPEPDKLTAYRPGRLTVATSVTTGVHPASTRVDSIATQTIGTITEHRPLAQNNKLRNDQCDPFSAIACDSWYRQKCILSARKSRKREAGNRSRQTPIQPDTYNTAAGDHGGHGNGALAMQHSQYRRGDGSD